MALFCVQIVGSAATVELLISCVAAHVSPCAVRRFGVPFPPQNNVLTASVLQGSASAPPLTAAVLLYKVYADPLIASIAARHLCTSPHFLCIAAQGPCTAPPGLCLAHRATPPAPCVSLQVPNGGWVSPAL